MVALVDVGRRWGLVAALLVMMPAASPAAENTSKELCTENLRAIAHALRSYVMLHDGKLPRTMGELYADGMLPGLDVLTCPASGRRITDTDRINADTDYELTGSIQGDLPILLVRERYANHGGKALAFYSNQTVRGVPARKDPRPKPARKPLVAGLDWESRSSDEPATDDGPTDRTSQPSRTAGNDTPTDPPPPPAKPDREKPTDPASYTKGIKLYKAEKYAEAVAAFDRAVRENPDHAASHGYRGGALFALKRYKEAEQAFRRTIKLDPKDADHHGNLAAALKQQERWRDAAAALRTCIRLEPDYLAAYYELARCMKRLRNWPEMEAAARKAVKLAPKKAAYQDMLAQAAFAQGKWKDADATWARACRLAPKKPRYFHDRAAALERLGKFPAAAQCHMRAIELAPNEPGFRNDYGNFLFNRRSWRQAAELLRQAIVLNPNRGTYRANYAGAVLMMNNRAEARRQAQLAIQLGVKKHWVFKRLGLSP